MRLAIALTLAAGLTGTVALAHHGWSWADGEQMTLQGAVQRVSMAPPHPVIHVTAADGVWQVDLGNPSQTQRSGFTAETAKVGAAVTILGNRSQDQAKRHMKAVRVTIEGRNYDMYPERIRETK